jgi:hypothetical protein
MTSKQITVDLEDSQHDFSQGRISLAPTPTTTLVTTHSIDDIPLTDISSEISCNDNSASIKLDLYDKKMSTICRNIIIFICVTGAVVMTNGFFFLFSDNLLNIGIYLLLSGVLFITITPIITWCVFELLRRRRHKTHTHSIEECSRDATTNRARETL